LIEGAAAPATQMAVDEVLLESAAEAGRATLRFYGWSQPTLSLGYFQRYDERSTHPTSRQCACVRRLTGGGAILHDRELTYCLALPRAHPLSADPAQLYDAAHRALVRTLATIGIAARLRTEAPAAGPSPETFLCFERTTRGDALVGETKICGSAQRRRRGAILQHGSLIVSRSPCAPEIPGILELCGRSIEASDFAARWGSELATAIGLLPESSQISPDEWQAADDLARRKYASTQWTRRR
jgi:lipoate-protein ligase A